jgi:hypothetical protein
VVMDADVKRALAGDFDFMCDCDGGAGQTENSCGTSVKDAHHVGAKQS